MLTTTLPPRPPREHCFAADSAKFLVDEVTDRVSSAGGAVFAEEEGVPMHGAVVLACQEPPRIDPCLVHQGSDRVDEQIAVRNLLAVEHSGEIERRQLQGIGCSREVLTRLPGDDRADAFPDSPDLSLFTTTE